MATLPGMADRTITISSGGKTFSATGWKVGWLSGPAEAVAAARTVKQFLTYVASGPFQPAVALALGLGDEVYAGLRDSLQAKRDLLCSALEASGLPVARPSGTYFVIADAAPLGCGRRARVRAPAARDRRASSGCRCRSSTTTRTRRARWSGSPSARRTRCCSRPAAASPPPGTPAPLTPTA